MKKQERIIKICLSCKAEFGVLPRRKETAKYCSDKCRISCLRPKDYVCTPEHAKRISEGKMGKKVFLLQNENHPAWKGDRVTYSGLHYWVANKLGTPTKCEHCGVSGLRPRQYHWANKSQEYKRDVKDWIRLCVPCHSKYDKGIKKNKPLIYA